MKKLLLALSLPLLLTACDYQPWDFSSSSEEQKEKFDKYVNFHRNGLMNVAVSIKTLEELTKKSVGVDLFYKYSPAFSQTVVHNFWAQSVNLVV